MLKRKQALNPEYASPPHPTVIKAMYDVIVARHDKDIAEKNNEMLLVQQACNEKVSQIRREYDIMKNSTDSLKEDITLQKRYLKQARAKVNTFEDELIKVKARNERLEEENDILLQQIMKLKGKIQSLSLMKDIEPKETSRFRK
jgi:predicted nuclease with TOPRIM domain